MSAAPSPPAPIVSRRRPVEPPRRPAPRPPARRGSRLVDEVLRVLTRREARP